MVYSIIDHRGPEMTSKYSKLIIKWNQEPYESDFAASFEHFDFISMDHLRV